MPVPNPDPVDNPLTLTYNGLWQLVENNPNLTPWLLPENKEKYDSWTDDKRDVSSSDLPELVLYQSGGTGFLHANSTSSRLLMRYEWWLTTGEFHLNHIHNQIIWELYRSMLDWQTILCNLQYNGERFVTRCDVLDHTSQTYDDTLNRGIAGWSCVWAAEVEMNFCTELLKIGPQPGTVVGDAASVIDD